jgi:hypothetical protein
MVAETALDRTSPIAATRVSRCMNLLAGNARLGFWARVMAARGQSLSEIEATNPVAIRGMNALSYLALSLGIRRGSLEQAR